MYFSKFITKTGFALSVHTKTIVLNSLFPNTNMFFQE